MDELQAGIASVLDPLAEAILVTEVQAIAQPLVMVRALIGHDVLLRQPRLVAAGQLRGNSEHGRMPKAARPTMNIVLPINNNDIKQLLCIMNFGRYTETI